MRDASWACRVQISRSHQGGGLFWTDCGSTQFTVEALTTSGIVWGGTKVKWGHKGGVLILRRGCPCEDTMGRWPLQAQKTESSPGNDLAGTLILNFQPTVFCDGGLSRLRQGPRSGVLTIAPSYSDYQQVQQTPSWISAPQLQHRWTTWEFNADSNPGPKQALSLWISDKLPGEADTTGPQITPWIEASKSMYFGEKKQYFIRTTWDGRRMMSKETD